MTGKKTPVIQETFLHAVWRYSLYRPEELVTTNGEPIVIIQAGQYNTNAGPDFAQAKIKIGNTTFAGSVELHVKSSDWQLHKHDDDDAYKNVILHVVYEDDRGSTKQNIPVLCIKPFIPEQVKKQYHRLIQPKKSLPCAGQINQVKDIVKESWLSRLLIERWQDKLGQWQALLSESNGDWRSLLYWRLAANFGFKVNADPFLSLARSIPLNTLAKHGNNLLQIEALLFGQAGMLEGDFEDEYPNQLKAEYSFLKQKYQLVPMVVTEWRFMRMRPANFPTIRIAQFAALIQRSIHLFSQIVEKSTVKEIASLFEVQASKYWNDHYSFDAPAENSKEKKLGRGSVNNIIINTVAPIKFLYAAQETTANDQDDALKLLDELPAEANHIIDIWAMHDWQPKHASQSQAQIQLYNNYCTHKKCTNCAIGISLLKS